MRLVENRKRNTKNQYAGKKRWGFSFDLKEESEDACLTQKVREFQIYRSDVLKGPLPSGPPTHHWDMKTPRLNGENEKENRDEATQRGMEELYQGQCGSR